MKFFHLTLLFFFLSLTIVDAQPFNVSVRAKHAIVYNPENGAVLFEKRAHDAHYPASITKIATALYVLEQARFGLDVPFASSAHALKVIDASVKQADLLHYPSYLLEHDGVVLGLRKGESLTLNALLYALMLVSANDAANVIAENYSGSIETFMDGLNRYLQERGIAKTRFQNPHGLHHPAQLTTAYDMARIAGMAFNNPQFLKIVKTPFFEMPFSTVEFGEVIRNRNPLLKEGKFRYEKCIGGKTGYTASSGHNLVAAAEENGRRLIVVLLGCEKSNDRFEDAIKLFEMAFREKPLRRQLFSKEDGSFFKALGKGRLQGKINQDIIIEYYPAEESNLEAKQVWDSLDLPIKAGQRVGDLVVEDERGNLLASTPLFAVHAIEIPKEGVGLLWLGIPIGLAVLGVYKKRRKLFKR